MPRIFDCFIFFNELDLLEIRLHELSPVVDKFVLVEATRTFQKNPKPLYYNDNKERFQEFHDKIIHVIVDDFPGFFTRFRIPRPFDYENHQRNQIVRGLVSASPDDLIIYSDIDEIPKASKVAEAANMGGTAVFNQILCTYYLNCICTNGPETPCEVNYAGVHYWKGSVMTRISQFRNAKELRMRRDKTGPDFTQIEEGGWHFSYMGGAGMIRQKLKAYSHAKEAKYQLSDIDDDASIQSIINRGIDLFGRDYLYQLVELDQRFPEYVVNHHDTFNHLIGTT